MQIDKPAPGDSEGVVTSRKRSPISHGREWRYDPDKIADWLEQREVG